MAAKAKPVIDLLKRYPHYTVKAVEEKEGAHSEAEWRREFPRFYKWVMGEEQTGPKAQRKKSRH